ncbi:MAG: sulfatase-like hydrolase/transferase [Candidatus Pacearchaeota archaeon]
MVHYSLFVSIILFLIAIYIIFFKKKSFSNKTNLIVCLMIFISILGHIFYFLINQITHEGINYQVIYYFMHGIKGAGYSEYFILIFIGSIFLILSSIFSIYVFRFNKKFKNNNKKGLTIIILLILSLIFNPIIFSFKDVILNNSENIEGYILFNQHYRSPYIEQINTTKNLVFIYLEGLERTYFNEDVFPNLTSSLKEIESESISFININQDEYSGHTIGGIVATQCGIPLVSLSYNNEMQGMDAFLENAVCLSDLLSKEGYYLGYYNGARITFSGKDKFLKTHNFDEIYGEQEILSTLRDTNYKNRWGIYDDTLLGLAYNRFLSYSKEKENFALFLLTLDTHFPEGFISRSCENMSYGDGKNPMLNSVKCSDYLIGQFVKKIRDSEFSNNTIIVIVSDHLSMPNTATDLLKELDRKNLFLINLPNQKEEIKNNNFGLTLDVSPTILNYLGFEGELGLGKNLNKIENKSENDLRVNFILENLNSLKPYFLRFWNFPRLKENLNIYLKNEKISIDKRFFEFPLLIKLDEKFNSKLYFKNQEEDLTSYISELNKQESFVLIDSCIEINYLLNKSSYDLGYCLLIGKKDKYSHYQKIDSNIQFSKRQLKKTINNELNYNFNESHNLSKEETGLERVAHAGGEINMQSYSNSFEALDNSLKKGFNYFEIDFIFTRDDQLVCLHDWEGNFENLFHFKVNERLSLKEFEELVKKNNITPCTIYSLKEWLEKNPNARIITDIKEENIIALNMISEIIPDYKEKIVPQIFLFEEYKEVEERGYERIIYGMYQHCSTDDNYIIDQIKELDKIFAVSMPLERAKSELPTKLKEINILTYVHTINTIEEKEFFLKKYNVNEIYTDYLGLED